MTDKQRARNCEKCKLRKSQEKWMGKVFDYRTCPFICVQNKLYHRLKG